MIERHSTLIELLCDGCGCSMGDGKTYDPDDFKIMMADARDNGWCSFRDGEGYWVNLCEECADE